MHKNDKNDQDLEFIENSDGGLELTAENKIKKYKEKIHILEKEKQEYLDGWQRARADYSNLIKTAEEDRKKLKEIFLENFITEFIPVIDSFQMAMGNKEAWEKVDQNWRTGVEYIYNQLMNLFENHGLKLFGNEGDLFDPSKYEAVVEEVTDDESKDHKVAKVNQKGLILNDKVIIRPARVNVFVVKKD